MSSGVEIHVPSYYPTQYVLTTSHFLIPKDHSKHTKYQRPLYTLSVPHLHTSLCLYPSLLLYILTPPFHPYIPPTNPLKSPKLLTSRNDRALASKDPLLQNPPPPFSPKLADFKETLVFEMTESLRRRSRWRCFSGFRSVVVGGEMDWLCLEKNFEARRWRW